MGEEENKTAIRVPIHINPTEKLLNDIACIVGGDCVKLMPAKWKNCLTRLIFDLIHKVQYQLLQTR